jgi:hypothetical protein
MKKLIKDVNWKRIGLIATGITSGAAAHGIALPWWVTLISGTVAGVAINGERIVAKRKTPSNPFDSVDAATKVERLR